MGQNDENWPFSTRFDQKKFAATNFGWFGPTFDFWSIFAILTPGTPWWYPQNHPFWVCPTLFGLKMGEISGFRPSRAQESDLRDLQMRLEVNTRSQIALDQILERFWCRGLVRTGDYWGIWGYF